MQSSSSRLFLRHCSLAGRNISNLRHEDDTTLMAESEEELKSFLKVKEDREKVGLIFNIPKTKIMASGPITSWKIDEETMETVTVFLGSEITVDGDCSHEMKRCLFLERKNMTNLYSLLKTETLPCQKRSVLKVETLRH